MKETSESTTLLFLLVFLFCFAATLLSYLGVGTETHKSFNLVIFTHPENAS
ncbi:MAG TPA: hypothetical protein VNJ01_17950 [Bacteriovoracaceae bacterium]|nr:hypothetical protein [Bacteriovoracaceae bacterium]